LVRQKSFSGNISAFAKRISPALTVAVLRLPALCHE
jgi:hypothetical protein